MSGISKCPLLVELICGGGDSSPVLIYVVDGIMYVVSLGLFPDLLFSPRAPVRLGICVKHALGGQSYPHHHKIPQLMHA